MGTLKYVYVYVCVYAYVNVCVYVYVNVNVGLLSLKLVCCIHL
jgi:hypothetical protein